MFLEARFNGTQYVTSDGHQPVTPFRLSDRSADIGNWELIVDQLPHDWNEGEYTIEGTPYPWCETLSDDCDCHGSKGRLDVTCCSDFGSHDEIDKRRTKSKNVWYRHYLRSMEEIIAGRDETRRKQRSQRKQRPTPRSQGIVATKPGVGVRDVEREPRPLIEAINRVNGLVAQGFYCSIHGRHHPYGDHAIQRTLASLAGANAQLSTWDDARRSLAMSRMGDFGGHWLQMHQSEECAHKSVWGDVEIPGVLYKYIPKKLIGNGPPNSLRATQLLALNDDMECNVTTMMGYEQEDTLAFLAEVQSKLEGHLGIAVPWEELLTRSLSHGDPRVSKFIQEYLNPLVGVVSFSTDILVPTMWAHYARNTGIVVGYDTETLRSLGFELRPVVYSELAPTYQPEASDVIRLDFVDRDDIERDLRTGRDREGFPILASTDLAEFGAGWESLCRLLLVKGMSWAYEKEVRLLVELKQAHDIGKADANGWPIKVIEFPPEAIKEIYGKANTPKADVERAVQMARGKDRKGLFVGRVSSHAFRIQKAGGMTY